MLLKKKKADPLRGAHGLYIYSKEKTLKITFAVNRDANIFVIVCPRVYFCIICFDCLGFPYIL